MLFNKGKKNTVLQKLQPINSPVVEKIYNFSVTKANLREEVENTRTEIRNLKSKLESKETQYLNNGYDKKTLKEIMAIKSEINELEKVANQQETLLFRKAGNSNYDLTEEDRKSLLEGFAPIREKQDELYEDVLEKMADLEKTLQQLHDERGKVEDIYSMCFQLIHNNAGEKAGIWADRNLADFPKAEIDRKLKLLHLDYRFDN